MSEKKAREEIILNVFKKLAIEFRNDTVDFLDDGRIKDTIKATLEHCADSIDLQCRRILKSGLLFLGENK